ncbi:MAG TPA: hypothetical protein VF502_14525 [Stellaceae bacterium]
MLLRQAKLWRGVLLLVGLALLPTGCATGPQLPLLTPIAVAGSFGYSEIRISDDRYMVTYVAPPGLTSAYGTAREADAQAARTLAFDMAVWRAAQIAEAQGFAGFRIIDRRSDVDTYAVPYYDPWDPWGCWECRRFGFPSYHDPFPYSPYAYLQARVTITVQMLHDPGPGDYKAAAVIEQLRRTYPGADGVLPPPAG